MKALFELGTNNSYKKEVLGNNLREHINSSTFQIHGLLPRSNQQLVVKAYEKELKALGDTSAENPTVQMWKNELFDIDDQRFVFGPLPLVGPFSLSTKREVNV